MSTNCRTTNGCPICEGTSFQEFCALDSESEQLRVVSCNRCGFLLSTIDRKAGEAGGHDRTAFDQYFASVGALRIQQAKEIVVKVERWKHGGFWVDVGCSYGYLLAEAQKKGFRILGFEPDETAYAGALRQLDSKFVLNEIMDEAKPDDSAADVISMLDVLEHIPSDELNKMVRLLHRKLAPDGICVIKVPSTEGLYFNIAHSLLRWAPSLVSSVIKRLWQSEYRYPHTVYFNSATLSRLLEQNGFKVLSIQYIQEVPNRTILSRLRMDSTISMPKAVAIAPALVAINTLESIRGKSDALLLIAQKA